MRQAVLLVQRLSQSICTLGAVIAVLFFAASPAGATYTYTYSDTFANPNQLFEIEFTLAKTSTVTAETTSWGSKYSGNFDPVLWLFDATTGAYKTSNNDIDDKGSYIDLDSRIEYTLGPGTYLFALSTVDQRFCVAGTVCNGQVYSTSGWTYDGDFKGRGKGYAVEFTSEACGALSRIETRTDPNPPPTQSNAPEPASAWLLLIGGALLGVRKFRCRSVR